MPFRMQRTCAVAQRLKKIILLRQCDCLWGAGLQLLIRKREKKTKSEEDDKREKKVTNFIKMRDN